MVRVRGASRSTSGLGFNATPMVDVIFMLTIFFMLVSRFSSEELVRMELPKPDPSEAALKKMPDRVIVNCRRGETPGAPVRYSLGPNQPEPLSVVADRLAGMHQLNPGLQVVVRADKRLAYADVRQVMRELAGIGIEVLNVVAHVSEEE